MTPPDGSGSARAPADMLGAVTADDNVAGGGPVVAPKLRLHLFGRMAVLTASGEDVLPRVRKTRAVLAILALSAPRPVLRDQLTGLLWSTRGRDQAKASLRQALHDLSLCLEAIGPGVVQSGRGYVALAPGTVWTDVQEMMRATTVQPEALDRLQRGPLLEDLFGVDPAFDRWLEGWRHRLIKSATDVAEDLLAEATDASEVIAAAQRLLTIERPHEAAWRALMQAHAKRGDVAGALTAYERCCGALAEAAAVGPSAETRALADSIRGAARPAPASSATITAPAAHSTPIDRAPGVRLGVMPFRSLDGRLDEQLSLGLAEEITTALARFRWISLVSSPSLAALAGESPEQTERLHGLDLDFLLDGTVQRGAGKVRVMVRLRDMRAGGDVVWAHRFDRATADILSLQDEIAAETVAQVDPELMLREGRRANLGSATNPTAYQLMLRAIPALYRLEETGYREAGTLLTAAVDRDPDYAAPHAWLAYWYVFLVGQGWTDEPDIDMARAGGLAERAIALDPFDARALTIAGHVRAFLHRRTEEAIGLHEQALQLNPNLPLAWAFSALAHTYAGRHDEAIRRGAQARRLSPFDPHASFFDMVLMIPHLLLGNLETAIEFGRRATALNPQLSSTYKGYLAALGLLGRTEDIGPAREQLLQLEPGFTVRQALARVPLQRQADRALYAEGLRRAGLPE